ncbi:hypothetical protein ACRQ5D_06990 [Mucilaginibacter sp. P25]|uniref:hypothetical protein n=1 Tax=Mucilaginibacter sp. P25 TaxID=3423945 RepID=UPI003D78B6AA
MKLAVSRSTRYLDTVIFNHPRDFVREDFKDFIYSTSVELPMLQFLKDWKKIAASALYQ